MYATTREYGLNLNIRSCKCTFVTQRRGTLFLVLTEEHDPKMECEVRMALSSIATM